MFINIAGMCRQGDEAVVYDAVMIINGLRQDEEATEWFFKLFGGCIVRAAEWKTARLERPLSEIIPPSGEAYLLLVWENNEDAWTAKLRNEFCSDKEKMEVPPKKYTCGQIKGGGR